ncbi:MAG: BF3164 family lipoprotein [Bacteroidota bacterium]
MSSIIVSLLLMGMIAGFQADHPSIYTNAKTGDNEAIKFPQTAVLQSQPADRLNELVMQPDAITTINANQLIVEENGVESGIFKIMDPTKGLQGNRPKVIAEFGRRGSGPGEFSKIISRPVKKVGAPQHQMDILDWSHKRLTKFQFAEDGASVLREFNIPASVHATQRAAFLTEDKVVAGSGSTQGMLYTIDTETGNLTYFEDQPKVGSELRPRDQRDLQMAEFTINYENERIVVAPNWYNQISIYKFDGSLDKRITLSEADPSALQMPNRTKYHFDVAITSEYIYTLHSDRTMKELDAIAPKIMQEGKAFSSTVHVYTWEGEPVAELTLKDKVVTSIDVIAEKQQIIATNPFAMKNPLVVFESELIK